MDNYAFTPVKLLMVIFQSHAKPDSLFRGQYVPLKSCLMFLLLKIFHDLALYNELPRGYTERVQFACAQRVNSFMTLPRESHGNKCEIFQLGFVLWESIQFLVCSISA